MWNSENKKRRSGDQRKELRDLAGAVPDRHQQGGEKMQWGEGGKKIGAKGKDEKNLCQDRQWATTHTIEGSVGSCTLSKSTGDLNMGGAS